MESSSKINPGTDIPEDLRARIAKLSPAKRALLELKLKESAGVSAEAAIPRQPKDTVCPLSFSQERLWFLDQFEAGTPVYNQARAMRLTGRLSLEFLKRALDEVVARHEALRTTVVPNDGNPIQKVNEGAPELTIVDLSDLGAAERRAEAEHLLIEKTRRPFDLSRDFMLRAVLIRLHIEEHILLLVTHHIATDAWSSGILWHELTEIYRALVCGERPRLRDLPIQYRDYAVWQRNILTGERLKAQLAYWSRKLANCPVLELPTDRPRPAVQTFAGAYRARTLPPDVCEELRGLSRRRGGTLFMTLLAALQVLLSRYSGQEEIAVGSPIAGRNRPEVEGLIGFFVNTLVLRADLSKNPTFSEFLGRVRETALDAYAHQDVPFEKIVEELRVERNLGYSPLFQVMFAHQNVPREPVDMPGLTLEPVMVDHGTAKFDLTLFTIEDRVGLKMIMEYNRDLFDADTIERMLEHFETLLRDIARDPEQRLSRLNLLTEREKRELAAERNATRTDHPAERCVHELFEAQARREPGRVAVSFGEEEASYGELEGRSNQVARYLRKVGVGPGVLVGVFMERSVEMVVGLLGILKAGGAYVPLDPSYPKDRLRFMIEDAGVGVLLTQERLVESLPARAARVVRVDAEWERIGRESRELEAVGVSADQLAYVIYTSGSTGKPKGVEVTHGSVVNFLSSMRREPGLCERDVLVAVTTLSFDIAGLELFLPLTVGARVVLVSREVASDGMRLAEAMAGAGGTVMQATPATWQMLLEAGWQGSKDLKIFCGGEALSGGLAGKLLERCSSLWNLYGPTETTIWSAVHKIDSAAGAIPIGGPIDNTQIYILDRYLNLVPVGVPGELYIGGAGLARGYRNRPELTAERFIPDPFSGAGGCRLYRTGDRARYRPDGTIEFLGRLDNQIKLRGFRIELGEIEAALRQHPDVAEAVVSVVDDGQGDKRLVAYVVFLPQKAVDAADLASFLAAVLPRHMVPSAFVPLRELPLTPNGKIDRKALPAPDRLHTAATRRFVAPRDELELQLVRIWEKILRTRPVGVTDNFFELGGHSLLAVRLFANVEKLTGKHLPLAVLFHAPTIEEIARILRQKAWSPPWSLLVPIQAGGSKPPFFAVHAHEGNVLFYRDLARHLGEDQPFYAFQARGLDGKEPPRTRIEKMAADYISELRTLQPEGPYFLGGYCFGGLLALEMAQQLVAAGEKVGLLALIDVFAPGYARSQSGATSAVGRWRRLLRKIGVHLANLSSLSRKERLRYVRGRLAWLGFRIYARTGLPSPRARARNIILTAMSQAAATYRAKPYSGPIALIRATKLPSGWERDPQLGWGRFARGGLEVHPVPGYFAHTILEPSVRAVAETLKDCLRRAQVRRPNSLEGYNTAVDDLSQAAELSTVV